MPGLRRPTVWALAAGVAFGLAGDTGLSVFGATQKDVKMITTRAKGEFEVKLVPQPSDDKSEGSPMGRMTIDKVFRGDLEGMSKGEMLTATAPTVKGSGVYVAVERVAGTLNGRKGTFALHHTGIMDRGTQNLTVTVVPDSGTGGLAGMTGTMKIIIEGKRHFYEFDYSIEN
ncbi:MAG: DUF3224 domain-containing protein [Vicinamibacterales bacterium]